MGGGSPMIRGFATNRLLYSVDGVRMNTAIFRSGNLQNVISIDPFAVENAEVLFGPGSVIYGSDAIGGVMSFNTLSPQFSLYNTPLITGSVVGKHASANQEKTAHFDINIGWKKWALRTSISHFNFSDLRQGTYGPTDYLKKMNVQNLHDGKSVVMLNENPLLQSPSAYSQFNLMQKIAYRPNQSWNVEFALHYSETSPYGRYDRHQRMRKGLPRYAEWNYGHQKWSMNNSQITHSKNNIFYTQFTTRIAYQQFEESRISRNINTPNRDTNTEKVNALSINMDFRKTIAQKHTLYYGAEWVRNSVSSLGEAKNIVTDSAWNIVPRYPQSNWLSAATYANMQFRLSDKWTLQSGVRFNHFAIDGTFDAITQAEYQFPFSKLEMNNGAVTGSLGVVYRFNNSLILSSNIATGFRSPNVDDMGKIFDSAAGIVVVPNPNLKAEYATNVDINLVKVVEDVLKIDLTAFYTLLDNAISRGNFQLNGKDSIIYKGEMSCVQALQNRAKATVYGLQAGAEVKLPAGFRVSSDINWQKGIETDFDGKKSPARHAAPLFGNTRLSYKHQQLSLQLYADYQAEVKHKDMPENEKSKTEMYALDAEGNVYAPAWYTLNFKANYRLNQNWLLSAGVENITNQRYRPYTSGISGAGRNFTLSAKVSW